MSLAVGGLTTGLGVAGMHYLGMAALRLHGAVHYDPLLVALSSRSRSWPPPPPCGPRSTSARPQP